MFRLVRESGDAPIAFGELRAAGLVAKIPQVHAQRIAPGMLPEDHGARRNANGLRRNNLVGERILDDPILMDAGFVRESVGAHDGLVRRHLRGRDFREHAAGAKKLFEAHSGCDAEAVFPHSQRDDNFFQRRVPGPLANSVDGAFDLANARADRSQ